MNLKKAYRLKGSKGYLTCEGRKRQKKTFFNRTAHTVGADVIQ